MTSDLIIVNFHGPFHEGLVRSRLIQIGALGSEPVKPSWERRPLRGDLSDVALAVGVASLVIGGARLVLDLYKLWRELRNSYPKASAPPPQLLIVFSTPSGVEIGRIGGEMSDTELMQLSQAVDSAVASGKRES